MDSLPWNGLRLPVSRRRTRELASSKGWIGSSREKSAVRCAFPPRGKMIFPEFNPRAKKIPSNQRSTISSNPRMLTNIFSKIINGEYIPSKQRYVSYRRRREEKFANPIANEKRGNRRWAKTAKGGDNVGMLARSHAEERVWSADKTQNPRLTRGGGRRGAR